MKDVTRYFGFAVVALEWFIFLACLALAAPDWGEPISQFGYYQLTRLIFGFGSTLAVIMLYLFARHLDAYWQPTSRFMLLAGVCLTVTVWIPYEPYVRTFILDTHNVAIMLAVIFYSLPMLFIGYKKVHVKISQISRALFFITSTLVGLSIIARVTDTGIIYAQLAAILTIHIWLVMTNLLLLQHHTEAGKELPRKL